MHEYESEEIWLVSDGYSHSNSTKGETQFRRDVGKKAATVEMIRGSMKLSSNKVEFLRNRANKSALINLLIETFKEGHANVIQSLGDADVLTCRKALEIAVSGRKTEVSGKDTDLVINLIHHHASDIRLYFRTTRSESTKDKECTM